MGHKHIDDVVSRFAAPPVTGVSEGARELMHEIMAGPPAPEPARSRRRLGLRVAIPAGALLAAGAVAATTWLLPVSPAAALDIKEEGGHYVIQIKDLYANPKVYEKQLRAAGLNVTLRVIPATAAFEGQVFPTTPDDEYVNEIKGIYPPGPCARMDGCAIGVKIPKDYAGTAEIAVSRKARPGEKYQSVTTFDAKGEPMACVPYLNKKVSEVLPLLKERGVRVSEYSNRALVGNDDGSDMMSSAPADWHVEGGFLTEPGVATLSVAEEPMTEEEVAHRNKKSQRVNGCSVS
ncbi:hypothetical protein [Nonomuraea candida]|uniref:hypothetical protein n=1 Tax=Nonomuraea candida TaxID=359159 RepID=UPI000693C9C6|nr:hypothetical protein [Nonomuraea candida]